MRCPPGLRGDQPASP